MGTRTFVLAVAGAVLAFLDQDFGSQVEGDGQRLRHQEQHDELLAHDAQGFLLPPAGCPCIRYALRLLLALITVLIASLGMSQSSPGRIIVGGGGPDKWGHKHKPQNNHWPSGPDPMGLKATVPLEKANFPPSYCRAETRLY